MVEQGCLLSSYTGKTGVGGSNPPLSAILIWPVEGKATEHRDRYRNRGRSRCRSAIAIPISMLTAMEPTVLWDMVLHAGAPQARVSRMDS